MSRASYEGQFNPQQIPIVRPEVRGRKDVADYSFGREPKAIAIHPWGLLFIASGSASQTSAEAEALKNCNDDPARADKDGPCFLYAIGNHVVLPLRITGPRPPAKTIAEAIRLIGPARAEEVYRTARPRKALVIEPESGAWSYWDGAPTAEVAERMALGQCQVNLAKPCILIATDRKSTRLNSSHVSISYAVFCLKKKILDKCCYFLASKRLRPSLLALISDLI